MKKEHYVDGKYYSDIQMLNRLQKFKENKVDKNGNYYCETLTPEMHDYLVRFGWEIDALMQEAEREFAV